MRVFLVATALILVGFSTANSQVRDTTRWIAELDAAIQAGDQQPATVGQLGILLAARASNRTTDFKDRMRAERLLEQALRGDPGNPRYLSALSDLYEKMSLPPARDRVVGRALTAMHTRPDVLTGTERADLQYRAASALESRLHDLMYLRMTNQGVPITSAECSGPFCQNWINPTSFNKALVGGPQVNNWKRLAVRADSLALAALVDDSTHVHAWRIRMRSLLRARNWPDFLDEAERMARRRPHETAAEMYIAVASHFLMQRGADSMMHVAIERMPARLRAPYLDTQLLFTRTDSLLVADLAPAARQQMLRAFWRARDPLFLTPENEFEGEYLARVAVADLLYADSAKHRTAFDSEAGVTLMRYGLPAHITLLRRNGETARAAEMAALLDAAGENCGTDCGENALATVGRGGESAPAGRYIFWTYSDEYPSFIFEKELGAAPPRMIRSNISSKALPPFRPPFEMVKGLSAQLVRLRGENADETQLLAFGRLPAPVVHTRAETGFFIMEANAGLRSVGAGRQISAGQAINFQVRLAPGKYSYSLEGFAADRTKAATLRGDIATTPWHGFAISDVLITTTQRALTGEPVSITDFEFEPMRCLEPTTRNRVGVLFEIYNLATNPDRSAHYTITITFSTSPTATTFTRQRPAAGTRLADWFEIDLPKARNDLTMSILVRDEITKQTVTTTRAFSERCI